MKRLFALSALALAFSAQAEDLLAVYAQARSADPVLAIAASQRGIRDEQAVQARAALLPQWNLQATQGRSQPTGLGPDSGHQYSSSISQTLLDLGAMRTLDAARSAARAEELRLSAAEAELCARVAQAYFGALGAQATLQTATANEAA
ncbi:MAG TPA: TolC family protein, partial [Burkholderiaceae bacterium]